MTRKDSERDTERPHYYSQFWLDVAAGRKVIGTSKTEEGVEGPEPSEAAALRKPGRNSMPAVTDGYKETYPRTAVEPVLEAEAVAEPEPEFEDELASNVDEIDIPNIVVDETEVPDMDLAPTEEEEPEEAPYDEEEDDDWNVGRGRKKAKPGRQTKQPKKAKREFRGRGH